MPKSNLLIHLDISPVVALGRIARRARPEESGVDLAYLEDLGSLYETFVGAWSDGPVLRLPADAHDFRDVSGLRKLATEVEEMMDLAVGR
jgi:deoxyadenosine/deoxycytidine kinase